MSDLSSFSTHLNYVDGIALGIMGISIVIGLLRGFTREILSVLGWSGALYVTLWGQHYLQDPMRQWIGNPLFADLTTIIVLFISSLFTLLTISRTLSRQIKASVLGGLDRSLGFLFGAVRGAVLCVIIFIAINQIFKPYKRPMPVVSARFYPVILSATAMVSRFLPKNIIPPAFYHPNPPKHGPLPKIPERTSEELMERLAQPKPSQEEASSNKEEEGYGQDSRQDMERLFKTFTKNDKNK